MNRLFIVVPERSAGWGSGTINPLLETAEWQCYAALAAAGAFVEVIGEGELRSGVATKNDLIILADPLDGLRRRVEDHLTRAGGRLLIANDRASGGCRRAVWRTRMLRDVAGRSQSKLKLSPRHARKGLRQWIAGARPFTVPRPEDGEAVLATWGSGRAPALVMRDRGPFRSWRCGFPLDQLDVPGVRWLLRTLDAGKAHEGQPRDPVPGDRSAVVLLLHDVEEPLAGDSRGIETVISGLEACLDAEKKHGFSATYNLVGAFAEKIPQWIRRIAAEGHELASHGSTHRVMADLDLEHLHREVIEAERSIERICGVRIRGFRSPRSRWSIPLLDCLAARGYLWNAEGDFAPFPYRVPRPGADPVLRIPVARDDWDFVKLGSSPRQVLAAWMKEVRWAMERRCWVALGSHPSVLGIGPDRMAMFSDFLAWLAGQNVAVMTHAEAACWWRNRVNGAPERSQESVERCSQKRT